MNDRSIDAKNCLCWSLLHIYHITHIYIYTKYITSCTVMYIYFDLYLSIHILMRLGPNSRRFHPQTSSKLHRLSHLLSIGDFTFGSRASSPKSKDKPPRIQAVLCRWNRPRSCSCLEPHGSAGSDGLLGYPPVIRRNGKSLKISRYL